MRSRVKALLITAGLLCAFLLGCAVYTYILHAQGWYHSSAEDSIARYANVQQEDVRICTTQQDEDFLYAVWENMATGELSMTILERQNKQGRSYLRPYGACTVGEDGQDFNIFQTQEGAGSTAKSLVVVACDNRSNALDHCELIYYTEFSSGGYTQIRREMADLSEPFLLRAQWISGNVRCVGAAIDQQGSIVSRAGGYIEDFKPLPA